MRPGTITGAERGDEIGTMAKVVEVFRQSMIETKRLRHDQEEMKRQAEAERRAAMMKLADGFEGSVKQVVERSDHLQHLFLGGFGPVLAET